MKFVKKLGIAQLPVLIGLLIMMVALPVASNLVGEEQDTREKAATTGCNYLGAQCCYDLSNPDHKRFWCDNNLSCNTITYRCAAALSKDCDRCSSNFGCQRAFFKTNESDCEVAEAIEGTTTYQQDCSCPKRNNAGGGNDNACSQCSSDDEWYFCLRKTAFVGDSDKVTVVPKEGGSTKEECEINSRLYIGSAGEIGSGFTEYGRGDIADECVNDSSLCNDSMLHTFYKCSGSACERTTQNHFNLDSCTRSLQRAIELNEGKVESYHICFADSTCSFGDINCPANEPVVSCDFGGKTYKKDEVFCTNCFNSLGNACVGQCKAKSDGTDGGVINYVFKTCLSSEVCESGTCVNAISPRFYMYYCGGDGQKKTTIKTYENVTECENDIGFKCYENYYGFECESSKKCTFNDIDYGFSQTVCKNDKTVMTCNNSFSWDEKECLNGEVCRNGKCERITCSYLGKSYDFLKKVCMGTSLYVCDRVNNNWSFVQDCGFAGCENGECKSATVENCIGSQGEVQHQNWGCETSGRKAYCMDGTWLYSENCQSGYVCNNGKCVTSSTNPCDSKNCRWGCVDGKCKCNLNGTNYLSGARTCNITKDRVYECNDGDWNYNADICTSAEICQNGQCVINNIDPCDGKICTYGCENGKCKCYLDNKYYFDGQTVCSKTNIGYINRCSDGNWTKNVQLCKSDEVCENGQCRVVSLIQCTDHYGKKVDSNFAGCVGVAQVSKCLTNGQWSSKSTDIINCGVDKRCLNGQCQKIYCYGTETVSPNTKGCETTFSSASCIRDSETGVAKWVNQIDCGVYGCKDGKCNTPPTLIQCTDHYNEKVNSNNNGCINVFQISKCQDNGDWSVKLADVKNCGVDERCWQGKCEKIYCDDAKIVSPNATACKTTSSLAVCRRNPTTGVAEWGSEDPCESGECRNGGCVNEEKKCTQCTEVGGNRTRGDADCDGKVTLNDWALWFKEFESGNKGTEQKKTWFADFTCDGKVNNDDLNIWFTNYLIDQRK